MNEDVTFSPEERISDAVQQFETPFFLYQEDRLRRNCREFRDAFREQFPDFQPLYAVKANPNPEILKIIVEEGFACDCSSESEAWLAGKLAKGAGNVSDTAVSGMYTGNNNTTSELKFAYDNGLILNLDDISMVEMIKDQVGENGFPEMISFRINPGITKGGMESLLTAGPDAKFGVPFEKAAEAYRAAKEAGATRFGIHMMTGSNVLEEDYFYQVVAKLLEIVAQIQEEVGIKIEFMNIGGGFGVPYRPEEKSLNLRKVAEFVKKAYDDKCEELDLEPPQLIAEPGRFITADMGFLVGKVTVIKNSYKKFVGIDAGSNDMPRPSIYGAYHYVSVLNSGNREKETVSVVGRICENNDQFARDRKIPRCEIGDIIVIHNCGGHAYAMGHNYNGRPRHAEYLAESNGNIRMIRRAETIEDLFKTCEI